jgi:ubiquitin C-terminal hydrolase
MSVELYANLGLKGLNNLGNSCFANSSMQILSNTYELNDALDVRIKRLHDLKPDIDADGLLYEWNQLRVQLWEKPTNQQSTTVRILNKPITPSRFIRCLYQTAKNNNMDIFQNNAQNDMGELMSFMLDQFHKSLKTKSINERVTRSRPPTISNPILRQVCESQPESEYSEIYELFYFVIESSIYLPPTSDNIITKVSNKNELQCVLYLDIPLYNKSTLYNCLDMYTHPEWIDNYYYESQNIHTKVAKQLLFNTLPRILIICLKRLQFSAEHGDFCKTTNLVDFPANLNMLPYCSENYNIEKNMQDVHYQYQLYGIGNHYEDGRGGGHYTSTIKNANMKWYEYNDNVVKQVNPNSIVTLNAYCLFYRKITQHA